MGRDDVQSIYYECMQAKLLQLCLTLCDPMDCSPPGSPVHGILQARILEGLSCLPLGDLPDLGIEPAAPAAPALQADSLLLSHHGSPYIMCGYALLVVILVIK